MLASPSAFPTLSFGRFGTVMARSGPSAPPRAAWPRQAAGRGRRRHGLLQCCVPCATFPHCLTPLCSARARTYGMWCGPRRYVLNRRRPYAWLALVSVWLLLAFALLEVFD